MLDLASMRPSRFAAEVGAIPGACASQGGELRVRRLLWLLMLILSSNAAGIVWADRGGLLPTSLGLVAASSVAALGFFRGVRVAVRAFVSPRTSQPWSDAWLDAWRVAAWIALALLAFALGHAALLRELDRARAGRALLLEQLVPRAIRPFEDQLA